MKRYLDGMVGCLKFTDCGETVRYCCNLKFRVGFMLMAIVQNGRIVGRLLGENCSCARSSCSSVEEVCLWRLSSLWHP